MLRTRSAQSTDTQLRARIHPARAGFVALIALAVTGAGCGVFDPEPDEPDPDPPPPVPAPTIPDNLIEALEVIYNDKVRNASERDLLYASLFPPEDHPTLTFIFRFQKTDIGNPSGEGGPPIPESWGLASERASAEGIFSAQDSRQIFSLELTITRLPPTPLEFPGPEQEDWRLIFASNVNLRLMFNPEDGLEVNGGQAEYLTAPADDRWYITEWRDLPRP